MKKHIFVILLIFCSVQLWSQVTAHVNKSSAKSISLETPTGSKIINFTLTGLLSESQANDVVQVLRSLRGVEEIISEYDATTGVCSCTGRFYKYANRKNFAWMLEKAGIEYIELNNKTMPVADFKNSEL